MKKKKKKVVDIETAKEILKEKDNLVRHVKGVVKAGERLEKLLTEESTD